MKTETTSHELPSHFFVSDTDGALHDTRHQNWHEKPLRSKYRYTFRKISTVAELKATLRAGEYAWPGGYPLYFTTSDGAALSFESVWSNLRSVFDSIRAKCSDGWRVIGCDVNWEDADLHCEHSGKRIPSAYAD